MDGSAVNLFVRLDIESWQKSSPGLESTKTATPSKSIIQKNSERQKLTIEDELVEQDLSQFQFFSNYFANFEKFRFNAYLIFCFCQAKLDLGGYPKLFSFARLELVKR